MANLIEAEKGDSKTFDNDSDNVAVSVQAGHLEPSSSWYHKLWYSILTEFTETRGVARVPAEEKQGPSQMRYVQMISLWASANLTANHATLGLLGPAAYDLSFLDSALCALFGVFVGAACTGYIATFGPRSGCRSMIIARYSMGWWPSRICALLNLVIMFGYGMIDTVVGGQMLSAVSGGSLSVVVGVIIVAFICWVLSTIGIKAIHSYETYGWILRAAVLFLLAGCAGPYFNTSAPSTGNSATVAGNRLSWFALCVSAPSSWAPAGADFFVYFPAATSKRITFLLTWLGETLGYLFALFLGIGLASGLKSHPSWGAAHEISPGAVVVAGFEPLGGFGKFCAVIMMLGVIGNNVPGTYSCGLGFQCLGSWPLEVPRIIWTSLSVVIYTICGAVGRNHLYAIFENFLSLIGYWVTIWIVITLQDQLIFRKNKYVWEDWNDKTKLPIGLAALTTFVTGYAGAVLCMDQVWFVGPISKLVGDYGSDMGLFVGSSWAALLFPPLRWLELKYIGR